MNSLRNLQNPHSSLFADAELRSVMDRRIENMKSEVERIDQNRLLNTPTAELANYLVEKYAFEHLTLHVDKAETTHHETKLDVSQDPMRQFVYDYHQGPFLVDATRVELYVPFSGDEELFKYRPDRWMMTVFQGQIQGSQLIITHTVEGFDAESVNRHFDQAIQNINTMIGYIREMVTHFNNHLPNQAQEVIDSRRSRLLKAANMADSLKFPLRRRESEPSTFAVPAVRKRITAVLPPSTMERYQPEPTIDMAVFEEILRTLRSMSLTMERSPTSFRTLKEEDIRTLFLVSLNATFEGEASGETFNGIGKTDIIIRHQDHNLFIGECKFWAGPKKFNDTIDQLMGYVTWRDTKAALLLFNRGQDTSKILATVRDVIKQHPRFKRVAPQSPHGDMRVILCQERDPNREVIVEIQIFDVPGPG